MGSGECSQIGQGQYIGAFMGFQLKLPKAVIMIGMVPKISSLSFSKTKLLSDRARADTSAPGASSCLTWNFPVIPWPTTVSTKTTL